MSRPDLTAGTTAELGGKAECEGASACWGHPPHSSLAGLVSPTEVKSEQHPTSLTCTGLWCGLITTGLLDVRSKGSRPHSYGSCMSRNVLSEMSNCLTRHKCAASACEPFSDPSPFTLSGALERGRHCIHLRKGSSTLQEPCVVYLTSSLSPRAPYLHSEMLVLH